MQFSELANELVLQIFQSCTSVRDILALQATNRHFHSLLSPVRRLPILYAAAEHEYGPLSEAVQIITYNPSQPAQHKRTLPETLFNLKNLVKVGKIAKKWEAIYPEKKWRDNFIDRRLLNVEECLRLRRAVYRFWLYCEAFHTKDHVRTARRIHSNVTQRAALLRNWTTAEIGDIEDFRLTARAVLEDEICPSNAVVRARQGSYLKPPTLRNHMPTNFHQYFANQSIHSRGRCDEEEGWGDEITHYYVIEDVMKLNPQQVFWLQQNASYKSTVEAFLCNLGDWFVNNGETFGETSYKVCSERELDGSVFGRLDNTSRLVLDGYLGIVRMGELDGQS